MENLVSHDAIGTRLLQSVASLDFSFSQERTVSELPRELHTLFDHSGKRFRPALVFLFGHAYGLDEQTLAPYARAVEMTHTASLIHDDVIDEAKERRKVPTINARFTNTQAILAGDFLLARVIGDLVHTGKLEIIQDLTEAIKELADGEWLQAQLKTKQSARWDELEIVALKKTGSLMAWSCSTAAKLADRPQQEQQICRKLGQDIGLFFQMLDDINDFNPHSGKPLAADLINGQLNFVTAKLVEAHPHMREKLLAQGLDAPELVDAKHYVLERSLKLEQEIKQQFRSLMSAATPEVHFVFEKMLAKIRQTFAHPRV